MPEWPCSQPQLVTFRSMSEKVNIYDAKTRLSRLVARAEAGEEIIIARAGRPAARLVPLPDTEVEFVAKRNSVQIVKAAHPARPTRGKGSFVASVDGRA